MSRRVRRAAAPLVLLGAAVLAACSAAQIPSLQGLGRIGAQALPIDPEREREIGFGIAAQVAGRYHVVNDDALLDYVNLVGQSVAQQSVRSNEVSFHFGVLDTDDVNAYAAPGGYILITRGALALMESEAELAGVLGHELAHVDQKHIVEAIRRSSVFTQVRDEAELTGSRLDSIAAVGTGVLFTGLSRTDELEADSLGLIYARGAGYKSDGLLQFLRHLQTAEGASAGGRLAEWVATHPPTAERLAAVERQVAAAGAVAGPDGAARFRANVRLGRARD